MRSCSNDNQILFGLQVLFGPRDFFGQVLSGMDVAAAKERLKIAFDNWKARTKSGNWEGLAASVDRHVETIRLYAVGRHFPPLDLLPSLCKALGVQPIYVLFGIEEEGPGLHKITVSEEELELLRLFRLLPKDNREEVMRFIQFSVSKLPPATNVKALR